MLNSSTRHRTPPSTKNDLSPDTKDNPTDSRVKTKEGPSPKSPSLATNGDVTTQHDPKQSGGSVHNNQPQKEGPQNDINNTLTSKPEVINRGVKSSIEQNKPEMNNAPVVITDSNNGAETKMSAQEQSKGVDNVKENYSKQVNSDEKKELQSAKTDDAETVEESGEKPVNQASKTEKSKEKPIDPLAEKYKRYRKLSDDEALLKMKWVLEQLKAQQQYDTLETKYIMMLVSGMYFDYKLLRQQLAEVMVKEGYPETSLKMIKEYNKLGLFKSDEIWFPAYYILNSWWNYSDASMKYGEALAENDVVTLLTVNCSHGPFLDTYLTSKNVFYVLKSSLSILHNIARVGTVKHIFDENKTSEVIARFLNDEDEMFKILANLTIAHIADDDTNKKQILGPETIEGIINWTDSALSSKTKRKRGFSAFELVDGLNKLAVNDSNKMTIIDKGALSVVTKMLAEDDVTGQSSACRLVWTLSFDKNVRQKILGDSSLMESLEKLKDSPDNQDIRKNASGALWMIKGENDITSQHRPHSAPSKQHVMISYCWSDKEIVLKIKDELKTAGYPVWIDVERMGGSTLEAMAEAIEQASVVLMCMSEKYKNSPNCRTEAEYTFQLRKSYIPLMMQKKYKPDGWLGIILGAKLFFDFSGKYPFDKSFNGLVKEVRGVSGGRPDEKPIDEADGAITASQAPSSYAQPGKRQPTLTSIRSNVLSMGQPEVSTWLQNEAKLSNCLSQFQKFKIDGKLLSQLVVMRSEAPEFFYQCLEKRLNMDLTEILQFTSALDELGT